MSKPSFHDLGVWVVQHDRQEGDALWHWLARLHPGEGPAFAEIGFQEVDIDGVIARGIDFSGAPQPDAHLLEHLQREQWAAVRAGGVLGRLLVLQRLWLAEDSTVRPPERTLLAAGATTVCCRRDLLATMRTGLVVPDGLVAQETLAALAFEKLTDQVWFARLDRDQFWAEASEAVGWPGTF